jgi:hypothetical protein
MLEFLACMLLQDSDAILDRLHLGGQVRGRIEFRDPVAYAPAPQLDKSDVWYLTRVRVHLKIDVTPDVDVFAQAQDDRQFNHAGPAAANDDNLDLHQAFFEIRTIDGHPLSLKVGRQELSYGDQRLVSPLDWSNTGRAWDAVKIRYETKTWWIDVFGSMFTNQNDTIEDHVFYGLYASCLEVADHSFDLYALGRYLGNSLRSRDELGNVGTVQEGTFGFRLKGKTGLFDYTVEGAFQSGEWVRTDIRTWGFAVVVGCTMDAFRIAVEYTAASGDSKPADGHRNTFTPPFPFAHFYQGFADVFAWRNGHDAAGSIRWKSYEWATLELDAHVFWLDRRKDAWYNAAGAVIRRDPTGAASSFVGSEIDVHFRLTVSKSIKVWTGYSRFFAGDFVDDTGRSPDMDWFFLQITLDL